MPIISYAVEHPDGIVLVDTGMDPGLNDVDHFGEDERNGWFYRKNLRFFLGRGGWLGDRLQALDLDPARVSDVVIIHFHADHVGGFPALPTVLSGQAPVHVGPGNWPGHMGAFTGTPFRTRPCFVSDPGRYNSIFPGPSASRRSSWSSTPPVTRL